MFKTMKRLIAFTVSFALIFEQSGFAQVAPQLPLPVYLRTIVLTDAFRPAHIRGFALDVQKNLSFVVNPGDEKSSQGPMAAYFYTGLMLPDSSFWVNLRPDSPDRIIDPLLAQTDLGKTLLEADLQLKKDLSSLTNPNTTQGRQYWNKLYERAEQLFPGENAQIPTYNRPWIVPGEVILGESADGFYIYKAVLDVKLEQDCIKTGDAQITAYSAGRQADQRLEQLNDYSAQLIRTLILPGLIQRINSSKAYAPLRQAYYSLISAQWVKSKLRSAQPSTDLSSFGMEKKNLTGLGSRSSWQPRTYFDAYKKSFQTGEYSLQETVRSGNGLTVRSYFSGGIQFDVGTPFKIIKANQAVGLAMSTSSVFLAHIGLQPGGQNPDILLIDSALTDGLGITTTARATVKETLGERSKDGGKRAMVRYNGAEFTFENAADARRFKEAIIAGQAETNARSTNSKDTPEEPVSFARKFLAGAGALGLGLTFGLAGIPSLADGLEKFADSFNVPQVLIKDANGKFILDKYDQTMVYAKGGGGGGGGRGGSVSSSSSSSGRSGSVGKGSYSGRGSAFRSARSSSTSNSYMPYYYYYLFIYSDDDSRSVLDSLSFEDKTLLAFGDVNNSQSQAYLDRVISNSSNPNHWKFLSDKDWDYYRFVASIALAKQNNTNNIAFLRDYIARNHEDHHPQVQTAIATLGQINDTASIPMLVSIIQEKDVQGDYDDWEQNRLISAASLLKMNDDKGIDAVLAYSRAMALGDGYFSWKTDDDDTRASIIDSQVLSLGESKDPKVTAFLMEVLNTKKGPSLSEEKWQQVRASAALSLVKNNDTNGKEQGVQYLLQTVSSGKADTASMKIAVAGLGISKDTRAIPALHKVLTMPKPDFWDSDDDWEEVKVTAASSLVRLSDPEGIGFIKTVLTSNEYDTDNKKIAIEALGETKESPLSGDSQGILEGMLVTSESGWFGSDGDVQELKIASATSLLKLGTEQGNERALGFLNTVMTSNDYDNNKKALAAAALGTTNDTRALATLKQAINSKDISDETKIVIAMSLGKSKDPQAVSLAQSYLAARADRNVADSMLPVWVGILAALGLGGAGVYLYKWSRDRYDGGRQVEIRKEISILLKEGDGYQLHEAREKAALKLGEIAEWGDDRAIDALIRALPDVTSEAAEALGKIGDERAVKPLTEALKIYRGEATNLIDYPVMTTVARAGAAKALGIIGDERAVEPLIEAMLDEQDGYGSGRIEAAKALFRLHKRLPADEARERIVINAFLKALHANNYLVLFGVPKIIKKWAHASFAYELAALTSDPKWYTRDAAALAFGTRALTDSVRMLSRSLRDECPIVAKTAAGSLGEVGTTEAVMPLLASLWLNDYADVRAAAAKALGNFYAWNNDEMRYFIGALLYEENAGVKKEIIGTCAKVRMEEAIPFIEKIARSSKDSGLQRAAEDALLEISRPVPLTFEAQDRLNGFIADLESDNYFYKKTAILSLGPMGLPAAIEPLLDVLETEKENPYYSHIEEIIDTLGKLKAVEAVDALLNIAVNYDQAGSTRRNAIRAKAIETLGMIGGEKALAALDEIRNRIKSSDLRETAKTAARSADNEPSPAIPPEDIRPADEMRRDLVVETLTRNAIDSSDRLETMDGGLKYEIDREHSLIRISAGPGALKRFMQILYSGIENNGRQMPAYIAEAVDQGSQLELSLGGRMHRLVLKGNELRYYPNADNRDEFFTGEILPAFQKAIDEMNKDGGLGGIDLRATIGNAGIVAMTPATIQQIALGSAMMQQDLAVVRGKLVAQIKNAWSCSQMPCRELKEFMAVCSVKGESAAVLKQEMSACVLNILEKEEQAGIAGQEQMQEVIALL